jgi:hypothetical protein
VSNAKRALQPMPTTDKSPYINIIVDNREESAAAAADFAALSTMAWNHRPRSMEYSRHRTARLNDRFKKALSRFQAGQNLGETTQEGWAAHIKVAERYQNATFCNEFTVRPIPAYNHFRSSAAIGAAGVGMLGKTTADTGLEPLVSAQIGSRGQVGALERVRRSCVTCQLMAVGPT